MRQLLAMTVGPPVMAEQSRDDYPEHAVERPAPDEEGAESEGLDETR